MGSNLKSCQAVENSEPACNSLHLGHGPIPLPSLQELCSRIVAMAMQSLTSRQRVAVEPEWLNLKTHSFYGPTM